MTAPGSGEQITAELAEALAAADGCSGVSLLAPGVCRVCRARAVALLPVVEAYATRKAAEALMAAAYVVEKRRPSIPPNTDPGRRQAVIVRSTLNQVCRVLTARADALTATHPDHGKA